MPQDNPPMAVEYSLGMSTFTEFFVLEDINFFKEVIVCNKECYKEWMEVEKISIEKVGFQE